MALHLRWLTVFCLSILISIQVIAKEDNSEVNFKKQKIQIKDKKILVELAETDAQHEHGLMFRKGLKPNEGMLFIFKTEETLNFWMKNTIINLSIGYFDKNNRLIDIQEMKAMTSEMQINLPTYPSLKPAMYALEMSEGWFKKNKIELGSVFKHIK
ncbi:MAG: DUF192 domain-containing protein [Pseudobdellovibrio sp.]